MKWWDRHSGALREEMEDLAASGMHPQIDDDAYKSGKIIINIEIMILGGQYHGKVFYPDLYPYFRPILLVQGLDFHLRHYNPISGEICLLRRGSHFWQPTMTAAKLIKEMLPEWERASVNNYNETRLDTEDHQAEPKTVYFDAVQSQLVMMDSSWVIPSHLTSGVLKIALQGNFDTLTQSSTFIAWALELKTEDKKAIIEACASETLMSWAKNQEYTELYIPWTRLDAPPKVRSLQELVDVIPKQYPTIYKAIQHATSVGRNGLHGICFPEEAPEGGERDGWIFLAYNIERTRAKKQPVVKRVKTFWLVKADYAGEIDSFKRIPELSPIRAKSVAVFGLGCVGAPSALALARAGIGELKLLDADYVSAGSTCRWPLGLTASGSGKVEVLTNFIQSNYPFTKIATAHYPVGVQHDFRLKIGAPSDCDQMELLEGMVKDVDLIYDATAEEEINHLLSDLAAQRNIPYVAVASRAGGWGGNIVRIKPGRVGGCFLCYLYSLQTGDVSQPPFDPAGDELQPVGCGDLTFTAAGFDVEEISLAGVRMAVSTLCEGTGGVYPPISHDVGILSLRQNGEAVFPAWESFILNKHPKCPRCNK